MLMKDLQRQPRSSALINATFMIIDELMRLFEYLKYGVAFILVFIGFKLLLSKVQLVVKRYQHACFYYVLIIIPVTTVVNVIFMLIYDIKDKDWIQEENVIKEVSSGRRDQQLISV